MDKRKALSIDSMNMFKWQEPINVSEPEHYTDDFSTDRGYFTEENGTHSWSVGGGTLSTTADTEGALIYLHTYEKNVTVTARFKYTEPAESNAVLAFLARYNSPEAYVRLCYYAKSGAWCIQASEGKDFPLYLYARTYDYRIEPDTWHEITFTVDKDRACASLDGKAIISADNIAHTSPGRIAIGAERLTLTLDSFDAAFLSNQGTLLRGIVHHKLPDDRYREGGTVVELRDGTLVYVHKTGVTFTSTDNGGSWQRADKPWTDTIGYPNILRLKNGDFIKIDTRETADGRFKASQTSSDDGKTWVDGGNICTEFYHVNTTAKAINMNDKVTQISSGRIFYCQNYESKPFGTMLDGRTVFCEFYYSDDNGKTWIKSETDSWTLGGDDSNNVQWFGECKILECDDGSLRIYNSWNDYGCVVYSESHDGGVTWGPLVKMPELVCARSSMQFCRDAYADNETTYYMVWVYSEPMANYEPMSRSRLSLARSTDGKNWTFLGDLWRWESNHFIGSHICHIVDAFITTNRDYVICGAGCSEHLEAQNDSYHHAQRQHIYSIPKASLTDRELKPV